MFRMRIRAALMAAPVLVFAVVGSPQAFATTLFFQGFETDTSDFNYVTRVPSGTNGVTSATGSYHAEAPPALQGVPDYSFTHWGTYNNSTGGSPGRSSRIRHRSISISACRQAQPTTHVSIFRRLSTTQQGGSCETSYSMLVSMTAAIRPVRERAPIDLSSVLAIIRIVIAPFQKIQVMTRSQSRRPAGTLFRTTSSTMPGRSAF